MLLPMFLFYFFLKSNQHRALLLPEAASDILNLLWDWNHLQDVQTNSGIVIQLLHKATVHHIPEKKKPREVKK